MLTCQKHLFSLPDEVHYLNCATMSPLLKSVEEAGIRGILRKSRPYEITQESFFEEVEAIKPLFARLINGADAERVSIIPSVSYGMATVAKNLAAKPSLLPHQEIVVLHEEFPSDVYAWDSVCADKQLVIKTVAPPETLENRGKIWNERILEAISHKTCMVVMPPLHWTDGTVFDLVTISKRAKEVGALLAIDGTQTIGAFPFDVEAVKPDALVCAGYKCMMGPYSMGLAYYGEYFDTGSPIEHNWINRQGSDQFRTLVDYQPNYRPKGFRFSMGEQSNFILLPMMIKALEQLLEWTPQVVQAYAHGLVKDPLQELASFGYWSEAKGQRSSHLLGIRSTRSVDMGKIQQLLTERKVYVSFRGDVIRVAPSVYNTVEDMEILVEVLKSV
ncbi:MAG: aminotransferase class V-fold PLP-dependent enzyme [Spirosomataceae bacterium]